jgi:hypothetical protein
MPLGLGCEERRGFVKHLDNPKAGGGPLEHHLRRRSASPWAAPTCRRRTGPPPVARRPYTRLRFYPISAGPRVERGMFVRPPARALRRPGHKADRSRHRDWVSSETTPGLETGDAYRTAPRGATSTAAPPLAYSTKSRSPCLQRSTPESSASVETTWSITSSPLPASRSSYVTSMLSPLMSRTRSTMPP